MERLAQRDTRQTRRSARNIQRLRQQADCLSRAVEAMDCGVVALGPGGGIRLMTPRARNTLAEFFGLMSDHHLPGSVARWLRNCKKRFAADCVPQPLEPLIIERGKSRLIVRLVASHSEDLLLVCAECLASEPERLESLGLTRREAEVLCWVAQGKTNREIGLILGTSSRTIYKHLEHIFAKLGVETRTAAARLALDAARPL